VTERQIVVIKLTRCVVVAANNNRTSSEQ